MISSGAWTSAPFVRIIIPQAVAEELVRNGVSCFAEWISVEHPANLNEVDLLSGLLDAGESQAIVLAEEPGADLLLIDERRGWKSAKTRSLNCVRLLGVLAEAKSRGFVDSCQEILDAMIDRAGFWICDLLRRDFLAGVGEGPKM